MELWKAKIIPIVKLEKAKIQTFLNLNTKTELNQTFRDKKIQFSFTLFLSRRKKKTLFGKIKIKIMQACKVYCMFYSLTNNQSNMVFNIFV